MDNINLKREIADTVDNVIGRATKAPGAEDFGILRALAAVWSRENPGGRISGRRSATP
jgi:hypothetical protein